MLGMFPKHFQVLSFLPATDVVSLNPSSFRRTKGPSHRMSLTVSMTYIFQCAGGLSITPIVAVRPH